MCVGTMLKLKSEKPFLHFRSSDQDIEAPAAPDKTIPTVVIRPTIRHAEQLSKGNQK